MKRRKIIKGLSIVGVGGILLWLNKNNLLTWFSRNYRHESLPKISDAPTLDNPMRILTSPESEGPFYFSAPFRSDIREDRAGKELQLTFQILQYPDCTPIENAIIEIRHSDAGGTYSGYVEGMGHNLWQLLEQTDFGKKEKIPPSNEQQFLRGAQKTDGSGMVQFTTIFPGWYDARVPHIHFKIIIESQKEFISEFYFKEAVYQEIYTTVDAYQTYGKCPYSFENDRAVQDGEGLVLHVNRNDDNTMEVTAKIGIQIT